MPLPISLAPLVLLVALSLLLLLDVMTLWVVVRLRQSAFRLDDEKEAAVERADRVSESLESQKKILGDIEHSGPYKPLYERARTLAAIHFDQVQHALHSAGSRWAEEIPATSLRASLVFIPLLIEIFERVGWWFHTRAIAQTCKNAEGAIEQISQLQTRIANVPEEQRYRASELKARLAALASRVEAIRRPGLDLQREQDKLNEALGFTEHIDQFLSDAHPSENQVCAALPLMREASEKLDVLEGWLQERSRRKDMAESALHHASELAEQVNAEIAAEEAAGRPCRRIAFASKNWLIEAKEIQAALADNAYDTAQLKCSALTSGIEAAHQSLEKLKAQREQAAALHAEMMHQFQKVCTWTEKPNPLYDLDLTRPSVSKVETDLFSLKDLIHSEELELGQTMSIKQAVSDSIRKIRSNGERFAKQSQQSERLREQLAKTLPGTLNEAAVVSEKAQGCNSRYADRSILASIEEERTGLANAWKQMPVEPSSVKESELEKVVTALTDLGKRQSDLDVVCLKFEKKLSEMEDDRLRLRNLLDRLTSLQGTFGPQDADEVKLIAKDLEKGRSELEKRADAPEPDYFAIAADADRLFAKTEQDRNNPMIAIEAQRKRLTKVQTTLASTQQRLLDLAKSSPLDLGDDIAQSLTGIRQWENQLQTLGNNATRDGDEHAESGVNLFRLAESRFQNAEQENKYYEERLARAVNAVLQSEQDYRQALAFLEQTTEWDTSAWPMLALDQARRLSQDARSRLNELKAAQGKYTFQAACEEAGAIEAMARRAEAAAHTAQGEIGDTVNLIRNSERRLQRLLFEAESITSSNQGLVESLQDVKRETQDLREQSRMRTNPEHIQADYRRAIQIVEEWIDRAGRYGSADEPIAFG